LAPRLVPPSFAAGVRRLRNRQPTARAGALRSHWRRGDVTEGAGRCGNEPAFLVAHLDIEKGDGLPASANTRPPETDATKFTVSDKVTVELRSPGFSQ
jgi:hypothetical protein